MARRGASPACRKQKESVKAAPGIAKATTAMPPSASTTDFVREVKPYEFGGNVGTAFWMVFVPFCIFWSYGINIVNHGVPCLPDATFWNTLIFELEAGVALRPTAKGFWIIMSWLLVQLLFQQLMPGRMQEGVTLKNGRRLPYKLNGWRSWCATWALVLLGVGSGFLDPALLFRNFGSLMAWANIISYVGALYLYVHFGLLWRRWVDSPEFERDWGVIKLTNFFHDYWMGCARNPRIWHSLGYPVDLKFFFEARPGLILWVLLNWSNVAAMYQGCRVSSLVVQCEAEGDLSRIPMAILIITLAHHYYIFDYFWNEAAILTTTDIRHDPFGWMLLWGDFGFLPWFYSNSFTMYLAVVEPRYTGNRVLEVVCLGALILAIALFRLTNIQKHKFRSYAAAHDNDPTGYKVWGKPATWIETKEGSLMLTSGFWGLCRHPNYAPDMIMALVWGVLCCAHDTFPLVPFGYTIYFWMMDIHRFFRDEARCQAKYKDDWDRYVKAVPYCLIPGVW